MMKSLKLFTLAACLLTGVSASAITYSDLQLPNVLLDANNQATASVTGLFDLENTGSQSLESYGLPYKDRAGFDADTMDAVSGTVEFLVYDISGDLNTFSINLGNLSLIEDGTFNYYFYEASDVAASLLVGISDTGTLEYKVTAQNDSVFRLGGAYLEVEVNGPTSVPDGGASIILLGLGCLGLAGVRRVSRK